MLTQLLGVAARAGACLPHQAQVPADSHPDLHALSIALCPGGRPSRSSGCAQHQSICMCEQALEITGYVSS